MPRVGRCTNGGGMRPVSFGFALATLIAACRLAQAEPPNNARVFAVDDMVRLRREDVDAPASRGVKNAVWQPGKSIRIAAMRGETAAFQIIVAAGDVPLEDVSVELSGLDTSGPSRIEPALFLEHYVEVSARSRDGRDPHSSLGFSHQARPLDEAVLGSVPDALVPVALARDFVPYPFHVAARRLAGVWVDLNVPRVGGAGMHKGLIRVRSGSRDLAELPLEVAVADTELPFRAVSFLAYYGRDELADRIGPGLAVERQLLTLLHEHQIDALADLRSEDDTARLAPFLDGSLFTRSYGYAGPGEGVAPAAVAIGAYGGLGAPSEEVVSKVTRIAGSIPRSVSDVLLYAVDEDCESDIGPSWRRALSTQTSLKRVLVAHSCERPPATQDVDLIITPADHFSRETAAAGRAAGKRVWVYNGSMPRTGTLLLDGDPRGLVVDGWIAATHAVDRWFLWETTFWNDDNAGGRGRIDPFVTAESFHNRHHDRALLDGLLVYPGSQAKPFTKNTLLYNGVLPSIRLKALRRGIQDAGYIALARHADPKRVDAIARSLVPRALDESPSDAAIEWADSASFVRARDELRSIALGTASVDPQGVSDELRRASEARALEVPVAWDVSPRVRKGLALGAASSITATAAIAVLFIWRRRRTFARTGAKAGGQSA